MTDEQKKLLTSAEREALRQRLLEIQDDYAQPVARRLVAGAIRFIAGLEFQPPPEKKVP